MSTIKQKLLSAISAHPKLAVFSAGLVVTMIAAVMTGVIDSYQTAFAIKETGKSTGIFTAHNAIAGNAPITSGTENVLSNHVCDSCT